MVKANQIFVDRRGRYWSGAKWVDTLGKAKRYTLAGGTALIKNGEGPNGWKSLESMRQAKLYQNANRRARRRMKSRKRLRRAQKRRG